jgi:hypothetical protein
MQELRLQQETFSSFWMLMTFSYQTNLKCNWIFGTATQSLILFIVTIVTLLEKKSLLIYLHLAPLPQGILVDIAFKMTPSTIHCFLVPHFVVDIVRRFDEALLLLVDRDFWFRCALHGFTFGYVPQVLALTRRHGANSTANQLKRMQAKINYGYRLLSMPIPRHLIKFVHRELAEGYAELALAQLAARQWKVSWVSLWKAWHHHCAAAKLAGNRDKALWLVDLLRYIDQFRKVLLGKATLDEDPVLR